MAVGGDFFDFFPTEAGWILVLGDVTGKGVEAATMTALVRHGARVASQVEEGPSAILARLDQALREQPTLSPCSALCARLGVNEMVVSSAGHPHPLILRPDGAIHQLDGGGPLLGAWVHGDWPERTGLSISIEATGGRRGSLAASGRRRDSPPPGKSTIFPDPTPPASGASAGGAKLGSTPSTDRRFRCLPGAGAAAPTSSGCWFR